MAMTEDLSIWPSQFKRNLKPTPTQLKRCQQQGAHSSTLVIIASTPFFAECIGTRVTRPMRKVKAIIKAYYPSSEVIRHYFHHTGWVGEKPTKGSIQRLLSEGYQSGRKNKELYDEMLAKYRAWKKNLRDALSRVDREDKL